MLGEDRVDPLFSTSDLAEIYAAAAQPVSHVKDLEADEDIFELTGDEVVLSLVQSIQHEQALRLFFQDSSTTCHLHFGLCLWSLFASGSTV